ncbi:MAG: YraN family protein [Clostridia bacterium]|nr:YraN family protein [Clostridia bacterium]
MRSVGDVGESIAEKYLLSKGAKILARNYVIRGGEIDLIAELGETIVFVEVKLRRSDAFGSAYEAITPAKQRHICRAAKVYLQKNGLLDRRYARFDAILILPDGTIDHIERAFDYIG